ncbi:MAG: hypothetical protein ABIM98_01785 [candidate division WOR-3 bacterium]
MKRGGLLRSILIIVLLLVIIIYGGYEPFLSFMGYLSLKEKLNEIAKFSRMHKDIEEVRNRVLEELSQSRFYFNQEDVGVYYEGENIVINAKFSDTLKWLGNYIVKPINYKVEVKRLPVSID